MCPRPILGLLRYLALGRPYMSPRHQTFVSRDGKQGTFCHTPRNMFPATCIHTHVSATHSLVDGRLNIGIHGSLALVGSTSFSIYHIVFYSACPTFHFTSSNTSNGPHVQLFFICVLVCKAKAKCRRPRFLLVFFTVLYNKKCVDI